MTDQQHVDMVAAQLTQAWAIASGMDPDRVLDMWLTFRAEVRKVLNAEATEKWQETAGRCA